MLTLYNSLTRKKEQFEPIEPMKVRLYHCGPTVYWTQHIGNLRGMTMGDLLVRTLRYFGYAVNHVRNYTDVGHLTSDQDTGEDKMEKGMKREGLSADAIAKKYIDQFESDTKAINLVEPTYKPRATEYVYAMQDMVRTLLAKGYAYTTELAVYFDISKFSSYTALSRQDMDKLVKGAGKADVEDPYKKHAADFSLWFFQTGVHEHAVQSWESPFTSPRVVNGRGFPGWHIECSAMSKALLGGSIDIHMGGVEHIPIHHTNEIAQSEAANGVQFVRYWLHNEHLLVNNRKMAKSEGTGYALSEIVSHGFEPLALRYFFLSAQYRSQQNFTWEALGSAQQSLHELRKLVASWKGQERMSLSQEKQLKLDEYSSRFDQALENDLNIPSALSIAWELAKSNIPSPDKFELMMRFDMVLGLDLEHGTMISPRVDIPEEVMVLAQKRQQLRNEKKYKEADAVRKEIEEHGFIVEEHASGFTVKPKD